jgi:hypothetical protein
MELARQNDGAAILPVAGDAVKGMKLYSLVLRFGIGVSFGFVGRAPVWLTGPATMVAVPIWSVFDMAAGGEPNLFLIERLIFGVFSLCGLAGAVVGRLVRQIATKGYNREESMKHRGSMNVWA